MRTVAVKGNWNIARGKLKQKIAHLTGDEQEFTKGKETELVGLIQKRSQEGKFPDHGGKDCGCNH